MQNQDIMSLKIITIDGPASSGKSAIGFLFAKQIGFQFVDTGAIYRAGTLVILRKRLSLDNEEQNASVFKSLDLKFVPGEDRQITLLDGQDITHELSLDEVNKATPLIAAQMKVREVSRELQRSIASGKNTVMAGRDIGTEIFPNADLKFFITCSLEVRAQRRLNQLQKRGLSITYEEVYKELHQRDLQDSTRTNSPLRKPDDAIEVDTTSLSIEESVNELVKYFNNLTK